jgi:DNA polymerase sigma
VVVLKVLLAQHQLDKPFTGGIGSYSLYVLVASHVSFAFWLWNLFRRQ